jgi:hypothetical protein
MADQSEPTFRVNDKVVVVAPSGNHQGAIGTVTEVYTLSGMRRYVIEFEAGTTAVFFGFELKACRPL